MHLFSSFPISYYVSRLYLIRHSRHTTIVIVALYVRVFYYVPTRREGAGRGTRSGDSELLFFSSLSASFSDRSHKAGAKNRQLPNERQLSGDQLQEGPDRRIRCNRPMSTVQHLWPFQRLLLLSRPPCNFSRDDIEGKGNAEGKERSACRFRLVRRTRH